MRGMPILLVLLGLLFTPGYISAGTLVPVEAYGVVSRLVLESRYAEAERVIREYIRGYPEEPLGYLLAAAVIQYEGTDYEDFSREEEFRDLLNRAESLGKRKLKEDSRDLWAHYAVNSARCFRGVRMVSEGSFVRGYMASRSGASGMAWIRSVDSRFYDAYLCDGSYRFWKSEAARSMHVSALMGDHREEGIADVETAIREGVLTGPIANTVLLEMLLEYDPEAAVERGERLTGRYTGCRLFAWQLGEAYKKLGRFDDAERVFTALAGKYASDPNDDGSGQIRCWWKMAVLSRDMGRLDQCRRFCEKVIDIGKSGSVAVRQASRIGAAKKLMTEMAGER